jgi:hypothetical protein
MTNKYSAQDRFEFGFSTMQAYWCRDCGSALHKTGAATCPNARQTADQLAVRILLSPKSEAEKTRKLGALAKKVTAIVSNKVECPESWHTRPRCAAGQQPADTTLFPTGTSISASRP